MPTLRLVPRYRPRPLPDEVSSGRAGQFWFFVWCGAGLAAALAIVALWWWNVSAETRDLRALPDEQRLPLYRRTLDNLKNICDPAAPRSLREFCHQQAVLALRFKECEGDALCTELARRHLSQPHR